MTAFPTDAAVTHHALADSTHLAALPTAPLAAYALGMLHMLQRTHAAVDCAVSACEAMRASDALARHVLCFLDDVRVPLDEKHALITTIEHATDLAEVQRMLELHALADGPDTASIEASLDPDQSSSACWPIASDAASPCTVDDDDQRPRTSDVTIPDALGCSICCDDLMLKPVSLLCGHSFCKRCVDMWLKSCANCPTCRHPVTEASTSIAVNLALHEIMTAFFPEKLKQLEDRDHMERLDELRGLIAQSIASGQSIRELVAQQDQRRDHDHDHHATQADVSELLESDPSLHERVLAAEIRERLRKEKALREESRRRHVVAYCGALPASSRAHVSRIHTTAVNARPAPAPTPSVQSHRPVKKYVPPPPKKSAFFGNLLRRLHHDDASQRPAH